MHRTSAANDKQQRQRSSLFSMIAACLATLSILNSHFISHSLHSKDKSQRVFCTTMSTEGVRMSSFSIAVECAFEEDYVHGDG
jgi:hypothetical protein